MVVGGQHHAPAALPPRKSPGTPSIEGWVDPRACRNGCWKPRLTTGFDLRTVQPVASRYADWVIPAHISDPMQIKMKFATTLFV